MIHCAGEGLSTGSNPFHRLSRNGHLLSQLKRHKKSITRIPRHTITENNLFFARSNVSDIFSPSDGENKPIDPAFPPKNIALPFRTENTRVAVSSLSFTQWVKDKLAC